MGLIHGFCLGFGMATILSYMSFMKMGGESGDLGWRILAWIMSLGSRWNRE